MGDGSDWRAFREVAELHRASSEIWQLAEWQCLQAGFAERLARLGLDGSASAGAALIAAAMYLSERTEEWGGDARDALGDLVQLGDSLIERTATAPPG